MENSLRILPRSLIVVLYLVCAISGGLGMLAKEPLIQQVIPLPTPVLYSVLMFGLMLPLLWKQALRLCIPLAATTLVGLLIAALIVFPRIQALHSMGRGNDQPDCVSTAAMAMTAGQWPYDRAKLWSHSPMSCGAGWVAVQAPFIRMGGYPLAEISIWVIAIVALFLTVGFRITGGMLALMALSSGFWLSAADGSDFLTFGVAIAALSSCVSFPRKFSYPLVLLSALLIQFRVASVLLPIFMSRASTRTRGIVAVILAVLCEAGFLLWNGASYISDGPLWITHKLIAAQMFSSNQPLALAEFLLFAIIGLLLSISIAKRLNLSERHGALVYLVAIIVIPALSVFFHDLMASGSFLDTLQHWGAVYMTGCLPLAALEVAINSNERSTMQSWIRALLRLG